MKLGTNFVQDILLRNVTFTKLVPNFINIEIY